MPTKNPGAGPMVPGGDTPPSVNKESASEAVEGNLMAFGKGMSAEFISGQLGPSPCEAIVPWGTALEAGFSPRHGYTKRGGEDPPASDPHSDPPGYGEKKGKKSVGVY